jgi:hypothetical protein
MIFRQPSSPGYYRVAPGRGVGAGVPGVTHVAHAPLLSLRWPSGYRDYRRLLFVAVLFVSGCVAVAGDPTLPNPKLTPGVALPTVTVEQVCTKGYANVLNGGVRNVPESEKRAVFIEYFGAVPADTKDFEVDHLCPLCLGGANSISNLWPQYGLSEPWNFHVKDRLEDKLYAGVKSDLKINGSVHAAALLKQYQSEITSNWTNCYIKYLGDPSAYRKTTTESHID